jgi:hypothetical protein
VVPGLTLTQFEDAMATKLRSPAPGGFAVTGITTVQCALPGSWTSGDVFPCYVYDKTGAGIGELQVTVESTQPGYAYNANLSWQPNAGYSPSVS